MTIPAQIKNFHFPFQIQQTTGAKVNFKDDAPTSDDERVVRISGTHESAQQAEVQVRKIIAEQPPIITDTITVPDKCIGRIIG